VQKPLHVHAAKQIMLKEMHAEIGPEGHMIFYRNEGDMSNNPPWKS
jgi:hypothetical protein